MSLDTALREQLIEIGALAILEIHLEEIAPFYHDEARKLAAAVVDALVGVQGWVCEDYAGLQMARPLCGTEQPVFTIAAVSSRATTPGEPGE